MNPIIMASKAAKDLNAKAAGVRVHIAGGLYVISGPTGNHEIGIEGTTDERLRAHLAGYIETALKTNFKHCPGSSGSLECYELNGTDGQIVVAIDQDGITLIQFKDAGEEPKYINEHQTLAAALLEAVQLGKKGERP